MTIEAALARLSAGLDEDEQAAKEVLAFEEQYHKLRGEGISVVIRYEWVRHTKLSTGGGGSMFFGGAPTPRDVVRGVEAIRKVIAEHQPDQDADASSPYCRTCSELSPYSARPVYRLFPCPTIRALAGIYPEPTEES